MKISPVHIIIGLCITTINTLANTKSIIKADHVFLASSSCEEITKETQGFKRFEDRTTSEENNSCQCNSTQCEMNIDDLVSPLMKGLLFTHQPALNGPNCFSTALFVKGFTPGIYYIDQPMFWLRSPLCKITKKPVYGDLIYISEKYFVRKNPVYGSHIIWPENMIVDTDDIARFYPYHMMVYLSEKLVFQKKDAGKNSIFEIEAASEYYKAHEISPNCVNKSEDEALKSGCRIFATYYSCESPQIEISHPLIQKLHQLAAEVTRQNLYGQEISAQSRADIKYLYEEASKNLGLMPFNISNEIPKEHLTKLTDLPHYSDLLKMKGDNILFWSYIYYAALYMHMRS